MKLLSWVYFALAAVGIVGVAFASSSEDTMSSQQKIQNAKLYLKYMRAPKPDEVGTPIARLRSQGLGKKAGRFPAGIAYATPGNHRLAVEARPAPPASRARVYTGCVSRTGGVWAAGSSHYEACMNAHQEGTTTPSSYQYGQSGKMMMIQF